MPSRPLLSILLALMASLAGAADGVTPTSISIGQCAALDGPAKGLGTGMNLGLKAALDQANAAGGVNGRKLSLVTVDDGYDPDKCIDGTVKLLEEDKVFCLAGYVGTPTAKAALPVITEKQVPLIGLFTGAMILRQPVQHFVFNVRASYDDETEALIERLTADLGVKKVAVFYQNDSFGQAGLAGSEKALKKRSLELAGKGTFERNTVAVKAGLATVLAAAPEAVIMVGPYKPIAAFVSEARAAGLTVPLATISFVGTENLIAELGDKAEGLFISQVVPSPTDESVAIVKDYHTALPKDAKPTYVSLEGYVSGRVLLMGLAQSGAEPTREGLIKALEGLKATDLGGLSVTYAADRHQALDQVWLTKVVKSVAATVTSFK